MPHFLPGLRCPDGMLDVFRKSRIALTLADLALPDQPLVLVNDPFCAATEYAPSDVLGRNCRFLQPPGGCGPVRARMRAFLDSADLDEARFIVPNQTASGRPFVNVVYLARLQRRGVSDLVLGSQFVAGRGQAEDDYEEALTSDLQTLSARLDSHQWMLLGSMKAIANTTRLLAQHHLDREGER